MEYLTAYHWQEGESALLLQQYVCRQTPVCFACLCSGQGEEGRACCREAVEALWAWCRGVPWQEAARKQTAWIRRLEGELEEILEGWSEVRSSGRMQLTILVCIKYEIFAMGEGQNLCLLNTDFGKGKAAWLPGQFNGLLEPGAGLLLATDEFLQNLDRERIGETLRLAELRTREQAERRLKELARDGAGAAAILLLGREEGCVY